MMREPDWADVGQKLLEALHDEGLTMRQLSKKSGVSAGMISNVCRGQQMSVKIMMQLCDALNLTPDYLLGYWEDN